MKNLETTEGAVSVVGRSCELVWAVPENDEIDDDFAEKVELEGEGGKTEDRLEIEEEFAIWFADVPDIQYSRQRYAGFCKIRFRFRCTWL